MEECIICFDETTQYVFFPCAHKVCVHCYKRLDRCPICNSLGDIPELHLDPEPQVIPRRVSPSTIACAMLFLFSVYVGYETLMDVM